jgi:hypothetical protein
MAQKKSIPLYGILLCFLAFSGTTALFIATRPWGIGVSEDSVSYIGGARSLLNGLGYRADMRNDPAIYFPPLFSLSLVCLGIIGLDPLEGARILHAWLFGLNALVVGGLLKKLDSSPRSFIPREIFCFWIVRHVFCVGIPFNYFEAGKKSVPHPFDFSSFPEIYGVPGSSCYLRRRFRVAASSFHECEYAGQ